VSGLVKWTFGQAARGVRLLTRHGLRLTRAIASTAFGPPQRGRAPEPASGAADRERPKAVKAASERGRGESAVRSVVPLSRPPEEALVGEARHTQTGATSTSAPHPSEDPEAFPSEGPKREKLDE
jgi:hypothetical protein